ncbi:hypothetical protein BCV69DRAFT_6762 [Microstroma glucosiphilum]|uniref:Uncharacterized protein n=1 Tax=Pseudomicrostroma glucosiphilum TaxID=1684307 RepID=A0A316UEL5_9BASI|nr:hypothetical protein BCV69DRAFT_6762 [Pseudomicrostroma glucosiphilum]PWN23652.1 hypothetical protein BCV69DRAFT_6762 [Pseudomicrostroma glucosiphilum]
MASRLRQAFASAGKPDGQSDEPAGGRTTPTLSNNGADDSTETADETFNTANSNNTTVGAAVEGLSLDIPGVSGKGPDGVPKKKKSFGECCCELIAQPFRTTVASADPPGAIVPSVLPRSASFSSCQPTTGTSHLL